jgi:hypothetical protein
MELRAIFLSLTPEVGADDVLLSVAIVPDGREGNVVYARTPHPNEQPPHDPVVLDLEAGDRLSSRPGAIQISILDIDRCATVREDGYEPITNTLWTWLSIGSPASPDLFRYLLATGRRLDGTHDLLVHVRSLIAGTPPRGFILVREHLFRALSVAEILMVALSRCVEMIHRLNDRFGLSLTLPPALLTHLPAITQIRHAFEHIDERALGQVRGRPDGVAVSAFDQRDFVRSGVLRYGAHSFSLGTDAPQLLLQCRQFVFNVAVHIGGPAKAFAGPLDFFGGTPGAAV